jgi:cation transport regulator ChaB
MNTTSSVQETEKKAFSPTSERSISAIYKTQKDVQAVIDRLKNRGIPIEHISVLGRDFSTDTRVSGFITKKDVILGGLKQGAIFGSLFGSVLSLLTGVGVLFIPFVGPVMAAGPLGAALLGAASGAIVGSAGAGLASLLVTLGMPEDKAAIYQTKVSAGEYLLMVEVPVDRAGEYQLLLESAGGEDIHLSDATLPRPCNGECGGPDELAPEVRSHLSAEAQNDFIATYNRVLKESDNAGKAEHEAWDMIRMKYQENETGVWG